MSRTALRLGLDLGTSAVKAVALDDAGTVVAAGDASYPTRADMPGQAEQSPLDWLRATGAAVRDLQGQLGDAWPARVQGIGLAGQLPTLVCFNAKGPLDRAIAWCDARADAWAGTLIPREVQLDLYAQTGMPIDGRYLAPMLRFHWPDHDARIRHILSAKDYLCFALTGRRITDASTAAGYGLYDIRSGAWSEALCRFWNVGSGLLPEIGAADGTAGGLNAEGAALLGLPQGLPVSIGAADSVAAALAIGGLDTTTASLVMGSSTIVIASTDRLLLDPMARYLLTPHVTAGWYGREMDLLATGTGFRWISDLFGWDRTTFEAAVLAAPVGANGISFAPYLAGGEQGALWNPALAGLMHGLNLRQGPGDIARAYLEGVFFEIRRCLEVLAETQPLRRLVLSGHAAGNPGLLAMLADIVGGEIQPYPHPSPSAIGAALLAPGGDPHEMAPPETMPTYRPGEAAGAYEMLYRRYLELFPRIAEA